MYLFGFGYVGSLVTVQAFYSCSEHGPFSICSMQDPQCNGSLVAEHRLKATQASALAVHGLSRCGSQAQPPCYIWDPPGQGVKSVSVALQGRLNHWTIKEVPYDLALLWIFI